MNILYVANKSDVFGGGEVSLLNLVDNLDRSRFTPFVVCPGEGALADAFKAMGLQPVIIPLPTLRRCNPLRWVTTIHRFIRFIRYCRIDCIHSNGSRAALYSGMSAQLMHIPFLAHFRVELTDGLIDRLIALMATRVLVVSRGAARRFAWLPDQKKNIIYNGVNTSLFTLGRDNRIFRETFSIKEEQTVIGYVGRLSPEKGLEVLLDAMAEIAADRNDISLVIVGKGPMDYTGRLHLRASRNSLDDRVFFAGYHQNLQEVYPSFDLLCLPSFTEAFNRSIIEAMSCGLPVIATGVGGNDEAVADGESGYIVPPGDPVALAGAIRKLTDDPALMSTMGTTGRNIVLQRFSIENNVRATQQVYESVVVKRKRKTADIP